MKRREDEDAVPPSNGSASMESSRHEINQLIDYISGKQKQSNERYVACLVFATRMSLVIEQQIKKGYLSDQDTSAGRNAQKIIKEFREWEEKFVTRPIGKRKTKGGRRVT